MANFHRGKRVSESHAEMLAGYERETGRPIFINQGRRTLAEQAVFYANYLRNGWPLAAKPWGGAPHIKWGAQHHALDVNAPQPVGSLASYYRKEGVPVAFNVAREPWHMDIIDERALIRAAEKLRANAPYPVLLPGARRPQVKKLKRLLWANGFKKVKRGTKLYGPTAVRSVKKFQKSRGLKADGVVGPRTWAALKR